MLVSTYRPGTLTKLECRFNKTTHHTDIDIVSEGVFEGVLAIRVPFGGLYSETALGKARVVNQSTGKKSSEL